MALSMIALEFHVGLADEGQLAFDGRERDAFTLALPDLFVVFDPCR